MRTPTVRNLARIARILRCLKWGEKVGGAMPSPTDQLLQKAVDRLGEWAAILQNPPEDFGLNPMRITRNMHRSLRGWWKEATAVVLKRANAAIAAHHIPIGCARAVS